MVAAPASSGEASVSAAGRFAFALALTLDFVFAFLPFFGLGSGGFSNVAGVSGWSSSADAVGLRFLAARSPPLAPDLALGEPPPEPRLLVVGAAVAPSGRPSDGSATPHPPPSLCGAVASAGLGDAPPPAANPATGLTGVGGCVGGCVGSSSSSPSATSGTGDGAPVVARAAPAFPFSSGASSSPLTTITSPSPDAAPASAARTPSGAAGIPSSHTSAQKPAPAAAKSSQ